MAMLKFFIGIISTILLFGSHNVNGQDGDDRETMRAVSDLTTLHEFFSEYIWLSVSDASELISTDTILDTLAAFQAYTGIPVTGKLDKITLAKLNSERCGNPDFEDGYESDSARNKRYTHIGRAWTAPYHVTYFIQGSTPDLNTVLVSEEFNKAFLHWSEVSALTFSQVFNNNADIIINFNTGDHGDGNPFDGRGNTLAHAYPPGGGLGGDAHFDDDETFTNGGGINLEQVATHEIGHSLGLGHSSDFTAIMAPFYNYQTNFRLGSDDINGIVSRYGEKPDNPPVQPATQPPAPPVTTTVAPTTTPTPPRTLPTYNCNGMFDASAENFDGGLYLFQGADVYTATSFGAAPGNPVPIATLFPGVPSFVDAAFLWRYTSTQKYLYIFKGDSYWRFYNGVASSGYPRSITRYWGGAPSNMDAVFQWTGNSRIYFIKGNYYYRYNTMSHRIDTGYPRALSVWRNVQAPVSSVLDYNGQTFFFTDQYFQIFSDSAFKASGLLPSAQILLGCQTEGLFLYGTTDLPTTMMDDLNGAQSSNRLPSITVIVLSSIIGLLHLLF